MGFSRQEYWSGLPCLPPGDLPDPGIEPESLMFPALAGGFFTTSAIREAQPNVMTDLITRLLKLKSLSIIIFRVISKYVYICHLSLCKFIYICHIYIPSIPFTPHLPCIWPPRWHSGKESGFQCRRCKRCRFDPWVEKIPWRRKWQHPPVFWPGKFHGQRSLGGYSSWGRRVGHD